MWDLIVSVPDHCLSFYFRDARRAQINVKLLTGSYILQSNRSKFNKYTVPCTCLLCKVAPEDLKHFLLECPKMQPVRVGYVSETEQILLQVVPDGATQLLADTELLCRTVMDCTVLGEPISGDLLGFGAKMETLSRNLCFALHLKRTSLLNERSYIEVSFLFVVVVVFLFVFFVFFFFFFFCYIKFKIMINM